MLWEIEVALNHNEFELHRRTHKIRTIEEIQWNLWTYNTLILETLKLVIKNIPFGIYFYNKNSELKGRHSETGLQLN